MMKKAPQTTVIEKFSHDGRGLARIAGKATFIAGALPGETVTFEYTRCKADFDEGRVLTVIESSPDRVEPPCPHFEICGGCSLQHIQSAAQIQVKQNLLLEVLQRIGHCQPLSVLPPLTAPVLHYRNKARLSVRYIEKKSATLIGFREKKNPRYIADIQNCPILHVQMDQQIVPLRQLLDQMEDKAVIAQIEVAAGDDALALIVRHLEPLTAHSQKLLQEFSVQTGFRIYLQPAGADSVHLFYPTDVDAFLTYDLPEFDLHFRFHPCDFTQINSAINRKMVSLAISLLDLKPEDRVLDLFCGLGNFSLPIAKNCAHVMGIEGSAAMITRAQMNAKDNHIQNADFLCANLEEWLPERHSLQNINKILLDPPRSGALHIVKHIHLFDPELIVYVSCNPVTLARDAEILLKQGYQFMTAGVMDMFPHTSHVESIAVFKRMSS